MEQWREPIAQHLGHRISDSLWAYLVDKRYIDELETGDAAVADVVVAIREMERALTTPDPEPAAPMAAPSRRPHDVHRWAISVLAADRAREDPDVVAYREHVLGGTLMAWADVPGWVKEHAEARPPTAWITVPVEDDDANSIVIDRRDPVGLATSARVLKYSAPGDEWVRLQVTSRGPLEQLRRLAERLAPAYAWTESQATVFVLADVVPLIATINATWGGHFIRHGDSHEWARRITLEVDPTVPPHELARTYQKVRERADHRGRRRLSDKHASLAAFAAERPQETWAARRRAWNQVNPTWSYGHDSNFCRDAIRAQARLLYPDWFHGATPLRG
jgi:hypothetical protein